MAGKYMVKRASLRTAHAAVRSNLSKRQPRYSVTVNARPTMLTTRYASPVPCDKIAEQSVQSQSTCILPSCVKSTIPKRIRFRTSRAKLLATCVCSDVHLPLLRLANRASSGFARLR